MARIALNDVLSAVSVWMKTAAFDNLCYGVFPDGGTEPIVFLTVVNGEPVWSDRGNVLAAAKQKPLETRRIIVNMLKDEGATVINNSLVVRAQPPYEAQAIRIYRLFNFIRNA